MNTTEIFNYANVKVGLDNINTSKESAKQALDNGTRAIETTITANSEGADAALSGASATAVKQKWDNLSEKFVEFTNKINDTIARAEQASKANQSFESETVSTIG